MAAFDYIALNAKGREEKGVLEGDNPRQIRQQLREKGLTPLEVKESSGGGKSSKTEQKSLFTLQRGISPAELALVTRQLSTLINSGLPLEESLRAVAQQSEKQRITSMILSIRSKVLEGHTLADGFAEFPKVFPEIYLATVAAGEQSGHLDGVLDRLADYTENRQATRQKVSMALIYPIILVMMALLIVTGLLAYVVPQVVQVFDSLDQELPGLTTGLIAVSDFIRSWGIYVAIIITAGVLLFKRHIRDEAALFRFHKVLLKLPMIAKLIKGHNTGRFARTLSILAASGVPVLEALKISSAVVTNRPMRRAVEAATLQVREGSSLSRALENSKLFPPMMLNLIASGESSGQLEAMLERAAEQQEREMEGTMAIFLGLFEPLVILFMGIAVLIIVLAILLPIFELNQMVG
ncbi:MAG: type II secretion system inner membrane protein GspF [Gammaproteobacteria bacterium]|nr:type II secretion system inner membrane protein GspF [Gammaproteobacteria bacterium]